MYLPRTVDALLDRYLPQAAAISLDGAKGVGKTAPRCSAPSARSSSTGQTSARW